jgi:glycosyltransferase involved in cell wall biosynthesis
VRVAILAPLVAPIREPHCGGSQAFVADLARGLAGRGHDVELYAASGSHVGGVEVIDTGVDHRGLQATLYRADAPASEGGAAAAKAFGTVYAAIGDGRYDVVHNHAFDAPAIALAADAEAPVLHTLHLPPERGVARALEQALRTGAPPAIACVSATQAQAWRAHVPVDALLPPYVPTRAIPFAETAARGALFAGRLSPEKGAADAIDIARAADIPIDVFGEAYDARYARERIEPRRALPGVAIHGGVARTELWRAMARASVVLCPARWEEPFGMAAAEAQACGTPVVAFARGALVELIVDGVTGFLVAPGDIDAAADAVRGSAPLSRARCRQHAEAELDLELTLDAHERLYERLVTSPARSQVGG